MNPPLPLVLAWQALALILSLSVLILLVFWHQWRTAQGRALFEFVGSLLVLQGGTVLTHVALLADLNDSLIKICANFVLIGCFLVVLTSLALLLHAAQAMKDAWELISRVGVTALVIVQPAIWQHPALVLSNPLDENFFGSPYTAVGQVAAGVCGLFAALTLYVGWHYWRRIDAAPVTGAIMALAMLQGMFLLSPRVRELALPSAGGGAVSVILGYTMIRQFENRPQPSQVRWLDAMRGAGQIAVTDCDLSICLRSIAEYTCQLLRTDAVYALLTIGPDRLEIAAAAGKTPQATGRQIRIGEGLAGRVMQSLQSMRVENYRGWNGRARVFDDLPLYASLSVPLIYGGSVVGVINAHETLPGRVFNDRDQTVLELLAPHATLVIVQSQLERKLHTAQQHVQALLAQTTAAVLIFDAAGTLSEQNALAQRYLQLVFGERATPPSSIELAAHAQDSNFTEALVNWTVEPHQDYRLQTAYQSIGRLAVQLQSIPIDRPTQFELVVTMRALSEPATLEQPGFSEPPR